MTSTDDGQFLSELRDKEAIRQVIYNFARAADRNDRELMRSCFHPDAMDHHGAISVLGIDFFDEVSRWEAAREKPLVMMHHNMGQVDIRLDGDQAYVESYVVGTTVEEPGEGSITRIVCSRYLDRFEQRDGAWKIAARRVIFDAVSIVPGGFPDGAAGVNVGKRTTGDVSYELLGR